MKIIYRVKNLTSFYKLNAYLIMTLSSLGFSFGIIITRMYGETTELSEVLRFQSIVALASFILQLGYRASLRKYYYNGYKKIVSVSHDFFYIFIIFSACMVLFVEFLYGTNFFIVSSLAVAYLTFLQTQAVVEKNICKQLFCALGNFVICSSCGVALSFLFIENFIYIELFAFGVILLFFRSVNLKKVYNRRSVVLKILYLSQSYQIGSFMIVLMVFIVIQSVVTKHSETDLVIYLADAQLISGFLVLFIGQLLILFERILYNDENINYKIYVCTCAVILLISMLVSWGYSLIQSTSFYNIILFMIILNSRFILGYIVQYVKYYRASFNFLAVFIIGIYFVYYSFYLGDFLYLQLSPPVLIMLFGFFVLSPSSKKNNET